MARLILKLLGGFRAELSTGEHVTFPTRKAQALMAYLALPPGRVHLREKLASLLWRDLPSAQARSGLRQAVFALRKSLAATEPAALRLVADTVALDPAAVDVDVCMLERLAREDTPDALERASAVYEGDLLAGFGIRERDFEDWLLAERERLREVAITAMTRLLAHHRAAGAYEAAAQTALRLLALDPLQEAVHRTLMRIYMDLGRRGAALRQYQHCAAIVQRELGAAAEPATRALYQEILRERPAPVSAAVLGEDATAKLLRPRPHRVQGALHEAPLIGREAEMARLRELRSAANPGQGRVVAILGEAGIGKTRLIGELSAEATQAGVQLLTGRAYEGEEILAFGPWVDALRTGHVAEDAEALTKMGPAGRAELARLLPVLLPEVGTPAPAGEGSNHLRLFEAVGQLLQVLGDRRPLVLVLEDLHWADEMSVRLLAFLARRIHGSTLIVVSARDEEMTVGGALARTVQDLARDGHLIELPLAPLSRAHTVALVRALSRAADQDGTARLAEQIWAASEGNPFVVIESVRAFAESGAPASDFALPARVQAVIERRFEQLSAPARRLATVAAVIGRDFEFPLLPSASELPDIEAAEAAEELVRRRILHGVGERFEFTHDRIRETIHRRLLPPQRKILHRRVAEALERLHAADPAPHALALGLHYRDGGVWGRAANFLRQAGAAATARSAHREAVACFEHALAAIGRLPDTPATREQAIDLRFDIRNSYFPIGEDERTLDHLHEAEALAAALNDGHRQGWALTYISNTYWRMADQRRALDAGERALELARTLADARLEAMTNFRLGQVHNAMGDYRRAVTILRASTMTLDGDLARERFGLAGYPAVHARAFLAVALAELGHFPEAITVGEQALRIAETVKQPFSVAIGCLKTGVVHVIRGDLPRAIEILERGRDTCRSAGMPTVGVQIDAALGHALSLAGKATEGLALLEHGAQSTATMFRPAHVLATIWLAEAHALAGHLDAAADLALQALDLARQRSERGSEAYALRLLGDIAAARMPAALPAGEEQLATALSLASELGMRPLVARCHLALGGIRRHRGSSPHGEEHLAIATTMFREMDMPVWLARSGARPASRATAPVHESHADRHDPI